MWWVEDFPWKTIAGYSISHYFSISQEEIFNLVQDFKWVLCLFVFSERYIISFLISFQLQQNIPALLQDHSVAEMIMSVYAQTKCATRWMTAVITQMKKSVVSTESTFTRTMFGKYNWRGSLVFIKNSTVCSYFLMTVLPWCTSPWPTEN